MNKINKTNSEDKLDEYEKEILEEIHSGESKSISNIKEFMEEAQASAQSFTKMKRKSIHIRIPEYNLTRIRRQADKKGLPYQTLINSILQEYLESGKRKVL
jgi:predicted DNA binding CopG/RHH family protein